MMNLTMGGDILGDLVGIATGHIYYMLKDIVTIKYDIDVLMTPEFLSVLIDRPKPKFVQTVVTNNARIRTPQFIPLNHTGQVSASFREEANAANTTNTDNNTENHQGNRFSSMSNEEPSWD
jgi:hypothetical protein